MTLTTRAALACAGLLLAAAPALAQIHPPAPATPASETPATGAKADRDLDRDLDRTTKDIARAARRLGVKLDARKTRTAVKHAEAELARTAVNARTAAAEAKAEAARYRLTPEQKARLKATAKTAAATLRPQAEALRQDARRLRHDCAAEQSRCAGGKAE